MRNYLIALLFFFYNYSAAQSLNENFLQQPWHAQWITSPGSDQVNQWNASSNESLKAYGVYKFRKSFELASQPTSFIVHVSGDNRYKLYVNGKLVSLGPARGDLYFWNFETVDIAKYLQPGNNTIAALAWNDGKLKPEAQISYVTGFILQGNTAVEEVINTNKTWKAIKDSAYAPLQPVVPGYYVAGPGEIVHMKFSPKNWMNVNYIDSNWLPARTIGNGLTKDAARDSRGWMLVPSPIPAMELTEQRLTQLSRSTMPVPANFPQVKSALIIPANTTAVFVLDQSFLTNAYPNLVFSKGKDAGISLAYAEALYYPAKQSTNQPYDKGNRNDIDGKIFIGKTDSIISDGTESQQYTSLWWRTYRFIQLRVTTRNESLTIDDIWGTFTGYPFTKKSSFKAHDTLFSKILEIGWRTARLCAFETYMDCPYYEQLQYIGDARIQALVTMYNTSDDSMVRNALTLMDHSRIAEGITLSRYPTDLHQQIPTFSLWYIHMLHDYWMYRDDAAFVKNKLPGAREILHFFEQYQQQDGSLKNVPYWLFTDWLNGQKGWDYGEAPKSKTGHSVILDLQLMMTFQKAAEMEEKMGFKDIAAYYKNKAAQLNQTIRKRYWDNSKQLFADTEDKDLYSQHANSLAILAGVVKGEEARLLGAKLINENFLAPASIYFKYYLHQALIKAGYGNDYISWLGKWKENIDMGLTTWAEMSNVSSSRSDCHAWGSSPNIEFFRTILGIDSDAPGFTSVKVAPHLGNLNMVSGSIPHPKGMIDCSFQFQNDRWRVVINLPLSTSGKFFWKERVLPLKPGTNVFSL
ncbi:MAG: alpha-L-rhamnosidase C-terminal domain-containing protein [Bacteroidota bacterium]